VQEESRDEENYQNLSDIEINAIRNVGIVRKPDKDITIASKPDAYFAMVVVVLTLKAELLFKFSISSRYQSYFIFYFS